MGLCDYHPSQSCDWRRSSGDNEKESVLRERMQFPLLDGNIYATKIEKRPGQKYCYANGRPSPLLRHKLLKVWGCSAWSSLVDKLERMLSGVWCRELERMLSGVWTDIVRSWGGCCSESRRMLAEVSPIVDWSFAVCWSEFRRMLAEVSPYVDWWPLLSTQNLSRGGLPPK